MVTPEQSAIAAAADAATRHAARPSLGAVWNALAAVADPEIPALSITELGMVRRVAWDPAEPGTLLVQVTPTYSGCPATDLIMDAIRDAVTGAGVGAVRVEVLLAPAWTTAFLTAEGARKLRTYGIAPPGSAVPATARRIDVSGLAPLRRAAVAVPCPRCGSLDTALVAEFGSTACKAQYRCRACLEPFDYFKPL